MMEFSGDEIRDIYQALNIWADYIETGSVNRYEGEKQDLSNEQVEKIIQLRELSRKVLNDE